MSHVRNSLLGPHWEAHFTSGFACLHGCWQAAQATCTADERSGLGAAYATQTPVSRPLLRGREPGVRCGKPASAALGSERTGSK